MASDRLYQYTAFVAARHWRGYKGCRCYDSRTGELKKSVKVCCCPIAVFVGKRREKLMTMADAAARTEALNGK